MLDQESVRITNGFLKYLTLECVCPVCGEITGTEGPSGYIKELKHYKKFGFWCDKTDDCPGEFYKKGNWGDLINKFLEESEA